MTKLLFFVFLLDNPLSAGYAIQHSEIA